MVVNYELIFSSLTHKEKVKKFLYNGHAEFTTGLQFWRYRYLTNPFGCFLAFNAALCWKWEVTFRGLIRMLEAEGDDQDQGHGDGAVPGVALQKRTSFLMNLLSSHETGDWRNPGNTLYVTGLPGWATERNLRELFRTQGEVIDCHLIRNYSTNESCGYAFVTMATKADAERCIQYFHHSVHFGRVIVVEVARRKRPRTPRGKYRVRRYEQEQQRRRQTLSHSPTQQWDEDRYSWDRSRSLSPVRKEDRYRYSSDRSRSQTPIQEEDRYQYSSDQRGRSRSPETQRRQR
ncbi:transformer-2 protein [Vigna unguiculata]|uniref:Transformer-2 protein n=1 Tax=Vigna unguiculata TaxID=3917 RepID=A0A4D6N462_VIGUN|nr:transformer-2 protein [Vigna unguiculata]